MILNKNKNNKSKNLLVLNHAFLLNDQIDILIAILVLIDDKNYFLHESQLLWYFKLDNDKTILQKNQDTNHNNNII